MASLKIKKGDTVKVITGKYKKHVGKVLDVNTKNNTVLVEGANIVSKHTKPSAANQQGGIVTKEAYIHVSNVMYVHKDQPARIGFQVVEGKDNKKKKVRTAKVKGAAREIID